MCESCASLTFSQNRIISVSSLEAAEEMEKKVPELAGLNLSEVDVYILRQRWLLLRLGTWGWTGFSHALMHLSDPPNSVAQLQQNPIWICTGPFAGHPPSSRLIRILLFMLIRTDKIPDHVSHIDRHSDRPQRLTSVHFVCFQGWCIWALIPIHFLDLEETEKFCFIDWLVGWLVLVYLFVLTDPQS